MFSFVYEHVLPSHRPNLLKMSSISSRLGSVSWESSQFVLLNVQILSDRRASVTRLTLLFLWNSLLFNLFSKTYFVFSNIFRSTGATSERRRNLTIAKSPCMSLEVNSLLTFIVARVFKEYLETSFFVKIRFETRCNVLLRLDAHQDFLRLPWLYSVVGRPIVVPISLRFLNVQPFFASVRPSSILMFPRRTGSASNFNLKLFFKSLSMRLLALGVGLKIPQRFIFDRSWTGSEKETWNSFLEIHALASAKRIKYFECRVATGSFVNIFIRSTNKFKYLPPKSSS